MKFAEIEVNTIIVLAFHFRSEDVTAVTLTNRTGMKSVLQETVIYSKSGPTAPSFYSFNIYQYLFVNNS